MKTACSLLAAACLAISAPAPLSAAATGRPAQDATVQAEVAEAGRLGDLIYRYDQAAWHATDKMLEGLTDAVRPLMRGYIVLPGDVGTLNTVFFGGVEGQLVEMARFEVRGRDVIAGGWLDDRPALSPAALRMVAARNAAFELAVKDGFAMCANTTPNVVILPPDKQDVISVYILTPPTEANAYPLGGHHRVRVDGQGRVIESRNFMKSCMPVKFGPDMAQNGAEPAVQVVSHLLDDAPTEIHAFVSRYSPIPIAVATMENRAVWLVANGQIRFLQQLPEEAARGRDS